MRTKNAMQLKARVNGRAREAGIPAQMMMQSYLFERLRSSVLADAMFDDPGLTIEAVGRALEARGMHVDDLVGLWDEAQDEVDESTGF